MSLLVLGLSHHTAPIDLLERVSLDAPGRQALLGALGASEHVGEAVVVSTCNRTEVYVEALTFHGAVNDVTEALITNAPEERERIGALLYLHFEDRAVAHTFRVASGLDSMAVGESQIRAQLRESLREAQSVRRAGPALNALFQQALRVGKRVHTETDLDSVGVSLVDAGYARAAASLGTLAHLHVLVIGAGAMASLAATTAARSGARQVSVVNRTHARGAALAARIGAESVPFADLPEALAAADVIVSCTGSTEVVLGVDLVRAAQVGRTAGQVYIDLALPHDVDHEVKWLPGVTRVGLEDLGIELSRRADTLPLERASDLVTAEVAAFLTARSTQVAAPTIAALRSRAGVILDAELARLLARTPSMPAAHRREVELAMGRLLDKLLHSPTVRVKQLAAEGRFAAYADALAELFELDPSAIAGMATPPLATPLAPLPTMATPPLAPLPTMATPPPLVAPLALPPTGSGAASIEPSLVPGGEVR